MSTTVTQGLVSVVVASYNHERYLEKRMDSLCAQTYGNMEIIVIDDCSPDNSRDVLGRYKSDPRVTLVNREVNGGWIEVSNQGLSLAKGEFVMFANCDDYCDDAMISELVSALRNNSSVGVAFCRSLLVDEEGCVLGDDFEIRNEEFRSNCSVDASLSGRQMQKFLLKSCVIPNLSAALIRRECFNLVGGFSNSYVVCSDWDLFLRIAADFDFYYFKNAHNRFRQHESTVRNTHKGKVTLDEYLQIILGGIHVVELSFGERCRIRFGAMYLWAVQIFDPATTGWKDIPHHAGLISQLDPRSLPFAPFAMTLRLVKLLTK
ncbi:glycosyltransferase [Pseudomonadales bacterium]|nr:glycosyltransferase [Pseudomonadales bacterium]